MSETLKKCQCCGRMRALVDTEEGEVCKEECWAYVQIGFWHRQDGVRPESEASDGKSEMEQDTT